MPQWIPHVVGALEKARIDLVPPIKPIKPSVTPEQPDETYEFQTFAEITETLENTPTPELSGIRSRQPSPTTNSPSTILLDNNFNNHFIYFYLTA